jgi:hypothetical protein
MLLALDQPEDTSSIEGFTDNDDALRAAQLLQITDIGTVQTGVISDLGMWSLLPVLQAAGAVLPDQDWFALARDSALTQQSFTSLSPVLLGALLQSADNRRVAETVLLANWLMQTGPLEKLNPNDLAHVITALRTIGQDDVAQAMTEEILRAHLLDRFAAGMTDGTAS